MAIFTPEYFALTAGDELDVSQNMPRIFGYYAGNTEMTGPNGMFPFASPTPGQSYSNFFGLRTDGSGAALTADEKKLPSAADQFNRGGAIMVYGPHQTFAGGGYNKIYIVYLYITSLPKKDTAYTVFWSYIEP